MSPMDPDIETLDDDALMVLFANADPSAAKLLTARLLPRALGHARRVLGNEAEVEDVAQEAMLKLWNAAKDWDQGGAARPSTWLYRVVANLCVDRLRKSGRSVGMDPDFDPADEAPGPFEALEHSGRLAALDGALAKLPERQRQAVVLRHIEGLSNPEIALALDIGVEAVESLTARGKRALASALQGQKEALGYGG